MREGSACVNILKAVSGRRSKKVKEKGRRESYAEVRVVRSLKFCSEIR
ncbi:hypothetical protein E2C01_075214 [Portunus trituberculatus]|uniref:Uncharacterized protein n=1 Tax=Portunus trituberculatus TaxID=210409 RepID=A0A5B7I7Y5_PORTR|nr:hypothetical protein [Portunus trituberculatus]